MGSSPILNDEKKLVDIDMLGKHSRNQSVTSNSMEKTSEIEHGVELLKVNEEVLVLSFIDQQELNIINRELQDQVEEKILNEIAGVQEVFDVKDETEIPSTLVTDSLLLTDVPLIKKESSDEFGDFVSIEQAVSMPINPTETEPSSTHGEIPPNEDESQNKSEPPVIVHIHGGLDIFASPGDHRLRVEDLKPKEIESTTMGVSTLFGNMLDMIMSPHPDNPTESKDYEEENGDETIDMIQRQGLM